MSIDYDLRVVIAHCNAKPRIVERAKEKVAQHSGYTVEYLILNPRELPRTPTEESMSTFAITETAKGIEEAIQDAKTMAVVSWTVMHWLDLRSTDVIHKVYPVKDVVDPLDLVSQIMGRIHELYDMPHQKN